MIRYDLVCAEGHEFDGWFRDSASFDEQRAGEAVVCPVCGTAQVDKALMAPGIAKGGREPVPAAAGPEAGQPKYVAGATPDAARLLELARELRRQVETGAENVGDRFADEARRIHYEEAEARSIYGEATPEDARALQEEGIEVFPLPVLPEDKN